MTDQEIDEEIDKLQASYEKAMELPTDTEKQINRKRKLLKQIENQVHDLICIVEVEHFLENGPMGTDPE
jgi:peptidoglycan hydrolase CwlO-like protein